MKSDSFRTNRSSLVSTNEKGALTEPEAAEQLAKISGWRLQRRAGVTQLEKDYSFPDFSTALVFTNQVAEYAEQIDHHPEIMTAWGRVSLVWYTHTVNGLQLRDFHCADYCDQLYNQQSNK